MESSYRIGEQRRQKNGLVATIVDYPHSGRITVEFEDGATKVTRYQAFKRGAVGHPDGYAATREGEVLKMTNGLRAKIVNYRGVGDVDIVFEDGSVVRNKTYAAFKNGHIRHPNQFSILHKGEAAVMNNSLLATITEARNSNDIDIQFQDGVTVKGVRYSAFKGGRIRHPGTSKTREERIGEKRFQNCGLEAEIIEYRNTGDIDVRFSNGGIVTSKTYQNFKKGQIGLPKKDRIGETLMMNCGLEAEIISYKSYSNIDVRFSDGVVLKRRYCGRFLIGEVGHPNLRAGKTFHGYKIQGVAFILSGKRKYYYVEDKSGVQSVMSPQQMISSQR